MRLFAVTLAVLATLVVPSATLADGSRLTPVAVPATDLADAAGAVAPSAAAGHVVFSRWVAQTGRYELVGWSSTRGLRVLPVGTRSVPFDADVGHGAAGSVVVAYSRCATDGVRGGILPAVDFTRARGCHPYILDLDRSGARPRSLQLAGQSGLSLTTPSVHGRSVAAVAAGTNARVLYWARTADSAVRLRGGSAPTCPYRTCPERPMSGVDALDLGAHAVAFVWRLTQPEEGVSAGQELRISSLRPGGSARAISAARGYVSGACGFRQPLSPYAGTDGVSFLLAQSPCDALQTTLATVRSGSRTVLGARPADALALGAAFDGTRVYWLRGTRSGDGPQPAGPLPCANATIRCRLVVSNNLPLAAPHPG